MDLQPLRIKEAVEGVITVEAVNNGGTAIIERWDGVHPDDRIVIEVEGKKVAELDSVGPNAIFPLELNIKKQVFLDHSGTEDVEFAYWLSRGSEGGNRYRSLPVSYSIYLAR